MTHTDGNKHLISPPRTLEDIDANKYLIHKGLA